MESFLKACHLHIGTDIVVNKQVSSKHQLLLRWSSGGMLAICETYMLGMWEAKPNLHVVLTKLIDAPRDVKKKAYRPYSFERLLLTCYHAVHWTVDYTFNSLATRNRCGDIHYALPPDVFETMIGKRMLYSCGLWDEKLSDDDISSTSIVEASENKLRYIAKAIGLDSMSAEERSNYKVLEIGCGWGSLSNFLVEEYGVQVTGITNASNTATRLNKDVNVFVGDMFDMDFGTNKYDCVCMIEVEHVGKDNYVKLFNKISKCLKKDTGVFFMESILVRRTEPKRVREDFVSKYVFPGGYVPSTALLTQAAEDTGMKMLYSHDLGEQHFPKTLKVWADGARSMIGSGRISDELARVFEITYEYLRICVETDRASMAMLMFAPRRGKAGCTICPPDILTTTRHAATV